MANDKKVFSASDAAPVVLYAKQDAATEQAYPIIASASGGILVHTSFAIPPFDTQVIDEADPNNITITYKLSGDTVATKTIVVSGSTTTISVT